MIDSYTYSALSAARRCQFLFDYQYLQRLELLAFGSEPLTFGDAWHAAFYATTLATKEGLLDAPRFGVAEARRRASSPRMAEQLTRLFSAYHWRYQNDAGRYRVVETEQRFEVTTLNGYKLRGSRDDVVVTPEGRIGVIERKTTGDSIEDGSGY